MLIPDFKLEQDEKCVIALIRVPYVKVSSCQFHIEQFEFKFYLRPYLLSLKFEQELQLAEEPFKCTYFSERHLLAVYLLKKNHAECFTNLNLLSSLLTNKKQHKPLNKKTLVEVVSSEGPVQVVADQPSDSAYHYGFCNNYHNVFEGLDEESTQLFLFDPASCPSDQRFSLSNKIVSQMFDQSSYLFDKFSNTEEIQSVLFGATQVEQLLQGYAFFDPAKEQLNYEEFKARFNLPQKQILVPARLLEAVWKQAISIAFSYVHQLLCMGGQFGPESAKTINLSSAVLSANVDYAQQTMQETIVDCSRRCISYSLYKHIDICEVTKDFLIRLLNRRCLQRILLQLRLLFSKSEPRYLLNRIILDDMCIFVLNGTAQAQMQQVFTALKSCIVMECDLDLSIQPINMNSSLIQPSIDQCAADFTRLLDLDD